MPAKSKAQFRFMKAVENGSIHPDGLSPDKAREFTDNISKKRFAKLREKVSKKG